MHSFLMSLKIFATQPQRKRVKQEAARIIAQRKQAEGTDAET